MPDTPEERARRAALEAALLPALLAGAGPSGFVETFDYEGDPRERARLVAHAASRGGSRRRPAIVFLHGKGGFAAEWRRDAVRALKLGFDVLLPELRGHPPSGGARLTYGLRETADLRLLAREAARRFAFDARRLVLDGTSMGALLALYAAAGNPSVKALWLRSPFGDLGAMAAQYVARATLLPRWSVALPVRLARLGLPLEAGRDLPREDPLEAARRVTCPAVVVHGAADELVPVELGARVFEALGGPKELWIVPRAGHEHHADEPSGLRARAYARRWATFLRRSLKGA